MRRASLSHFILAVAITAVLAYLADVGLGMRHRGYSGGVIAFVTGTAVTLQVLGAGVVLGFIRNR